MLRKKTRHTHRLQEIINVFVRNGFSHILFRLGLTGRITVQEKQDAQWDTNLQNIGLRLRLALQELGPTFIKLGQIASTRRDVVPIEIAVELEKLQDHVETVPFNDIRNTIEAELEDTIENLFTHFQEEPLASASIGQVHIAHLETGEEVAIKVQRPDIQETIITDVDILISLARLMEEKLAWAKTYRIGEMVNEFAKTIKNELDYQLEGRNADRFRKQFEHREEIHIPHIHWDYTTRKVLTMEMIRGIKVSDVDRLEREGYDRTTIAARIVDAMFQQVLEDGFFHADPHPGNLMILPHNVIAFLDFGMAGRLPEAMKFHFASLLLSLQQGDSAKMIKTFEALDIMVEDVDRRALEHDLDNLQGDYYGAAFSEISLGKAFADMFAIAYRHRIRLPAEISLVGKVILTLEGIIAKLDPSFSIMEAVEPYAEKLLRQRLNPRYMLEKSWEELVENIEIMRQLPKSVKEITRTIKNGKLRLDIHISDLQTFLKRLDRISNQLSLSIILLAFSILMVGLIIGLAIAGQTTMLWRLPVIEVGSVVATLMFLYLIYAIFKSGRI